MNIPRFWANTEGRAKNANHDEILLRRWGWSSISLEDAARHAQQRFNEFATKVSGGPVPEDFYAYGRSPIREQWLEELHDNAGDTLGVLTRNVYGAVILNTSDVMFLDIDLPHQWNTGLVGRLFGRKPQDPADKILSWLHETLPGLTSSGFRIYRTYAGLRLLSHDSGHSADSESVQKLMEQLNVDPAYRHLCKVQQCFRARLTPKPWRCGCKRPPGRYPHEDTQTARVFEHWLADYEKKIAGYATCCYLDSIGSKHSDDRATLVRTLHDELSLAESGKQLA